MTDDIIHQAFKKTIDIYKRRIEIGKPDVISKANFEESIRILEQLQQELIEKIKQESHRTTGRRKFLEEFARLSTES